MPSQVLGNGKEPLAIENPEGQSRLSRRTRLTGKNKVQRSFKLRNRVASCINFVKGTNDGHDVSRKAWRALPITTVTFRRAGGAIGQVDIGNGSLVCHS